MLRALLTPTELIFSHFHDQALDAHRCGQYVEPFPASSRSTVTGDHCSGSAHILASFSSRVRRTVQRWVRRSMPPIASRSNATYEAGTVATRCFAFAGEVTRHRWSASKLNRPATEITSSP